MSTASSHAGGPSFVGIVRSVRSLITPLQFEPAQPTHRDEPYRDRAGRGIPPLGDVYLPDGPGPHPSVVLIHGGGWVIGHRRMKPMRYLATRLLDAGYAVFVPDYRMVFRGGRLDEALDDATRAISWWLDQAHRFSLDTSRIVLSGLSAGATLMLLAADNFREVGFSRLLPVFGVYDFGQMHGGLGRLIGPLLLKDHDPEAVSPLTRTPHPSPVTLFHGTADTLVPYAQAVEFRDVWTRAGGDVELVTYDGLPHAYFNDIETEGCRRATADFLDAVAR